MTVQPPRFDVDAALAVAVAKSLSSPCAKSKRGVAIFDADGIVASGHNHPPLGFGCDGSERCRSSCRHVCVHAEMDALLRLGRRKGAFELVHVKTVGGSAVASGPPSCAQCSRLILDSRIRRVWLLHACDDEASTHLISYDPVLFHELSLENAGLPVIRSRAP